MEYREIAATELHLLKPLHTAYKREIGEDAPSEADFERLVAALEAGSIHFYGCMDQGMPVGCCSVSTTFSTFCYAAAGVFEDFYILPEYRHRGIARKLVALAARESGVRSLTVGCADCDVDLYKALGFAEKLGNLMAFEM